MCKCGLSSLPCFGERPGCVEDVYWELCTFEATIWYENQQESSTVYTHVVLFRDASQVCIPMFFRTEFESHHTQNSLLVHFVWRSRLPFLGSVNDLTTCEAADPFIAFLAELRMAKCNVGCTALVYVTPSRPGLKDLSMVYPEPSSKW